MRRTRLNFMVDPEYLATRTYVHDPVKIIITDSDSIFITGILGESGRKMVKAGAQFIFTRELAEKLVKNGVAREV